MARLSHRGFRNVHLVGNPAIDYIRNADWRTERPIDNPYVVVSYQAETIDGHDAWTDCAAAIGTRYPVFIRPNHDRGSDAINASIDAYIDKYQTGVAYIALPHAQFLNLIAHCEEFIGNSSSMLYEAPELGVKTRMIGKRQRGRTIPWGDGHASERIAKVLRYAAL